MKKVFIPALFLLISMGCFAQTDDEQHRTKLNALKKDTAFKRFQTEFNAIMKTANKSNNNFARIKALFTTNGSMLMGLKKKYNVQKRIITILDTQIGTSINKPVRHTNIVKTVTYTAPYTAKEVYVDENTIPQEPSPDDQIGKMTWTLTVPPGEGKYFSPYAYIFKQTIPVPADPIIVAARIKFHYSYMFTGWDTEGGSFYNDMRINANSSFNSPAYNAIGIENPSPYMVMWKSVSYSLYQQQFQEMHDYSSTKESTYTIEGYVVPGTTLEFRFGAVHFPGSRTGDLGAYHYSEYQLKKIEVTFLKAGN